MKFKRTLKLAAIPTVISLILLMGFQNCSGSLLNAVGASYAPGVDPSKLIADQSVAVEKWRVPLSQNINEGENEITLKPCPQGFAKEDVNMQFATPLYISGGVGEPEVVQPIGGTCTSGAASGTVRFINRFGHSNAATIESATAGIQEAINYLTSRGGGTVALAAGTLILRATIRISLFGRIHIAGQGPYTSHLSRTADYGDTFIIGEYPYSVPDVAFKDFGLIHDIGPTSGVTSIKNKPTLFPNSAHVRLWDCTNCSFKNLDVKSMPYGFVMNGGAIVNFDNNIFTGLWDHTNPALQVSKAHIQLNPNPEWTNPADATQKIGRHGAQLVYMNRNHFLGSGSPSRNVSVVGASGTRTIPNFSETVGPLSMIEVNGVESLHIDGGEIGGADEYGIRLSPAGDTPTTMIEISITDIHFDSSRKADIAILGNGISMTTNVKIQSNWFNGEYSGLNAIYIPNSNVGLSAVYGLLISDNQFFAHNATPIMILDASNYQIQNNSIRAYNVRDLFSDITDASGIFIAGRSEDGVIQNNSIGGGLYSEVYGSGSNHCRYGITNLSPTTNLASGNTIRKTGDSP